MLTDRDRTALDLEARHWRHAGTKEAAVLATLGLSATRYYQTLNRLAGDPEAIAYAPAVCTRIRAIAHR